MPIERERIDAFIQRLHETRLLDGVDRRLRVELALRTLGIPDDVDALRALLAPVVARNREEQERFYGVFDAFFERKVTGEFVIDVTTSSWPVGGPPGTPDATPPRRRWLKAAGILLGVVVAAVVVAILTPPTGPGPGRGGPDTASVDSTRAGDTVAVQGRPRLDTLQDADVGLPATPRTTTPSTSIPELSIRDLVAPLFVLVAALVAILATFDARRRKRIRREADELRRDTPPFLWTPRPPTPRLFTSSDFFDAARIAQRRQRAPGLRVSIERTVAATIAAAGMPTVRYERASRPPEYLLLIDRLGPGDHQALLFDALVQRLGQEGIYIERFFFERDPRVCRSEKHAGLSLEELEHRFSDHRLVILGTADALLDDDAAVLAPWTTLFDAWIERAILTPAPVASWGAREEALAEMFAVLPASTVGLRAIVEGFELEAKPDLRWWREAHGADRAIPDEPGANLPALRAALGRDVWRWLCVCAVYPDLHWALTLYLAGLPQLGGGKVLSEDRLLRLAALPWFREGFIPSEVRVRLLEQLDRKTERAARDAILNVLGVAPPEPNTAAGRWHEAQVLVQRVLAHPEDPATRAALRDQLEHLPRALLVVDPATSTRLRDINRSRLGRLVPRSVRRFVYRDGVSLFGMRPWAKRGAGAAAVAAVVVVPPLIIDDQPPTPPSPPPEAIASFSTVRQIRLTPGVVLELWAIPRQRDGRPVAEPIGWSSADPLIASVDSEGVLRADALGQTTVTVSAGRYGAQIPVIVEEAIVGRFDAIVHTSPKLIAGGETRQWTSFLETGADAIEWASCIPGIATVNEDGAVTAHGEGQTTILAASRGRIEERLLTVRGGSPTDLSILSEPVAFSPTSPGGTLSGQIRSALDRKAAVLRKDRQYRIRVGILAGTTSPVDSLNNEVGAPKTALLVSDAMRSYLLRSGVASYQIASISGSPRATRAALSSVVAVLCNRPRLSYVAFAGYRDTVVRQSPRPPATTAVAVPTRPRRQVASESTTTRNVAAPNVAQTGQRPSGVPEAKQAAPVQAAPDSQQRSSAAEEPAFADIREQFRRRQAITPAFADSGAPGVRSYTVIGTMRQNSYAFAAGDNLLKASRSTPLQPTMSAPMDFEVHNVRGGTYLVGFVSVDDAASLARSISPRDSLVLFARGSTNAPCAVGLPYPSYQPQRLGTTAPSSLVMRRFEAGAEPAVFPSRECEMSFRK